MTEQAGQQQQSQGEAQQGQQQAGQQQSTPPWGDDANFDPVKAWKLIENLRADVEAAKSKPTLTAEQKTALEEYDRLKKASQTELDKQREETTRWQTDAEKWRSTAVASSIRALAAADFEYPEDAVGQLDPAKYLDAGGSIDERSIRVDLEKLLEKRPNWRRGAQEGQSGPRAPRPNTAQGSGNGKAAGNDPATEFASILQGALQQQ